MPYGGRDLGQHWRHQAITWTNVDLSSLRSSIVHLRAISLEISQPSVTKISLEIIFPRFYWNLPEANELKCCLSILMVFTMYTHHNHIRPFELHYTAGCHYNTVQYKLIMHTPLQWLKSNINQSLSIQTHPVSHPNRRAMEWILWGFWKKLMALLRHRTVFG